MFKMSLYSFYISRGMSYLLCLKCGCISYVVSFMLKICCMCYVSKNLLYVHMFNGILHVFQNHHE